MHRHRENLSSSVYPNLHGLLGSPGAEFPSHLLPSANGNIPHGEDKIPFTNPRLLGGISLDKSSDTGGGEIQHSMPHQKEDRKENGKKDIDHGSVQEDEKSLPCGLIAEAHSLLIGLFNFGILPLHSRQTHKTPDGKDPEGPLRKSPLMLPYPGPHAKGKFKNLNPKDPSGNKMPPFMGDDTDAENHHES